MRKLIFREFGEPSEVLSVEDVPAPAPGAGEVRVRLTARPINPSDILSIRGLYGRKPQLPAVPGYEGAGQIEALGDGVSRWSVGQRVIPVGVDGTWQECLIVPEGQLIATPDTLSDAVAAQLLANPLSANLLLTSVLDAKPGDWVMQTAAASALGQLMIQLAKLNGINLINVVRSRHSLEIVKAAGAEHIIISGEENIAAKVPEITGKVPVTKAVDAVGGALTGAVAEALGYGATLVVYGSLSMEPVSLDASRLIFRDLTLKGFWLTDWFRSTPRERREAAVSEVTKLLASGRLKPAVEGEYDLADFAGAIAHAERQGRGGKIILIG